MAVIGRQFDDYRDRKILVFGAAGYIGRRVVEWLIGVGAHVGAVTRQESAGALRPQTTTFIADALRPGDAHRVVAAFRPAAVFNLVGYGVDPAERDDEVAARINSGFVSELIAACGAHPDSSWPGQHLIHAGSALEYGMASGDLHEETAPEPTTTYGRTKLRGTRLVSAAVDAGQVRGVTARLFTVYGPGERSGRLLPSLLDAARANRPVTLTSGMQQRDFTFVDDVAEGMLRLGRLGDRLVLPVNLATGTLESVRRFAERVADVIGLQRALLAFGELAERPAEMHHGNVNVRRLVELVGWKPSTGIEAGVLATLAERPAGETQ
jgi:nucleoside-diphosphate-sugar epimerase